MRGWSTVFIWAIVILSLTICAASMLNALAGEEESNDKMMIEVLIYSGRPNPMWELSTDEVTAVRKRLKGLPEIEESDVPRWRWSRLGFQGFRLRCPKEWDFPEEIRVFEGVICVRIGEKTKYFEDKNNLEASLIAAAKKKDLLGPVQKAIGDYEKSRRVLANQE